MSDGWILESGDCVGFCTIYFSGGTSTKFPILSSWKEAGAYSIKVWTEWAEEIVQNPECRAINFSLEEAVRMILRYRLVELVKAHHDEFGDGHWVGTGDERRSNPNIPGRSYALMTVIDHPYFFIEVDQEGKCSLTKINALNWNEAEAKMDSFVSIARAREPQMKAFAFKSADKIEEFLKSLKSGD
jgi:hypothetical protein